MFSRSLQLTSELLQKVRGIVHRLAQPLIVISALRLLPGRIVRITGLSRRRRPVERAPTVSVHPSPPSQSFHKVRIGQEQPSERQRVHLSALDDIPAVFRIPAPGRDERRVAHDLPERSQGDVAKPGCVEEGVFIFQRV